MIRNEGPRGGPRMREMLAPTSALAGAGMLSDVALITDGRFSGGSYGILVRYVCAEAVDGGLIALLRDVDQITMDAKKGILSADISKHEVEKRRKTWKPLKVAYTTGALAKYAWMVSPASNGAITG